MVKALRVSSCMAPNMEPFARGVAHWLESTLEAPVEYVDLPEWRDREAAFDRGELDLLWICGLPYVWKADAAEVGAHLVAAPVMSEQRYGNVPVYFSDVVVRKESEVESFDQLRGKTWSFNEPASHSGYNVVRDYLARVGLDWSLFKEVIEAGSHERSLQLIRSGEVDASAIDSTVLEVALRAEPEISEEIRVLLTFGPSPMPPWIVRPGLANELGDNLGRELERMHSTAEGKELLARWGIARFARVVDGDYDPIREMEKRGQGVGHPPRSGPTSTHVSKE